MRSVFLAILTALALILLLLAGCGGGGGGATVTVRFTSPSDGDSFDQGTLVTLTVDVQPTSALSHVVFTVNGERIDEADSPPWSIPWLTNSLAPGDYTLTALAYQDSKFLAAHTITVTIEASAVNVTITSPPSGTAVQQGATVSITAEATVPAPQSINRVEFTANGDNIGVDSTAPYSVNWPTTGVNPGIYIIMARAYDNSSPAQRGTDSILIEVEEPTEPAPTVNIDSPANGATVCLTVTVTVTAQAQAAGAVINNIQVTLGSLAQTIVGGTATVTGSVNFNTIQLPDGAYSLLAVATDSNGRGASDSIGLNVNNGSAPPPPPDWE